VAGTSIISPILPFLSVLIPAYVILCKSRSNVFENHPVLYMMTFGKYSILLFNIVNKIRNVRFAAERNLIFV
jgi:ethanolaminephosphotransferase